MRRSITIFMKNCFWNLLMIITKQIHNNNCLWINMYENFFTSNFKKICKMIQHCLSCLFFNKLIYTLFYYNWMMISVRIRRVKYRNKGDCWISAHIQHCWSFGLVVVRITPNSTLYYVKKNLLWNAMWKKFEKKFII